MIFASFSFKGQRASSALSSESGSLSWPAEEPPFPVKKQWRSALWTLGDSSEPHPLIWFRDQSIWTVSPDYSEHVLITGSNWQWGTYIQHCNQFTTFNNTLIHLLTAWVVWDCGVRLQQCIHLSLSGVRSWSLSLPLSIPSWQRVPLWHENGVSIFSQLVHWRIQSLVLKL